MGVPSCAPLLELEMLKAVRQMIPHAYERAGRELGLTVARTEELIERRVEIVSAARAIKLARMIAYEPNARDVFSEAGVNLYSVINETVPRAFKTSLRGLPRPVRARMALLMTRRIAHRFAGSVNRISFEGRREGLERGLDLIIRSGIFSDRLDTLSCAYAYYRNVFQTMFQQLASVDCRVSEVKRSRVHLNQCNLEIVWG